MEEREIEEIKRKISQNEREIERLNTEQLALKQVIVSAYGSIISPKNFMSDSDLGNAITKNGVESIQKVNRLATEFVKEKIIASMREKGNDSEAQKQISKLKKADDIDGVVVMNATDSAAISLSKCGEQIFRNGEVTEAGYNLIKDFCGEVNKKFKVWFEKTTFCNECKLKFKREKICDAGVWLKSANGETDAKNNYVLHVVDNEGVKGSQFKYAGVKFARSTISKSLKDEGKKIIENMILHQDQKENDILVKSFYEKYQNLSIEDKAIIQRCANMKDYDNSDLNGGYVKGTPGHIKAALNYNKIIKDLGLVQYKPIHSGDMAKIVFLENNIYKFEAIAFLDNWPREFDQYFKVDNAVMFEKSVFGEIKRFYKSVGWETFNPSDDYGFNLFDFSWN